MSGEERRIERDVMLGGIVGEGGEGSFQVERVLGRIFVEENRGFLPSHYALYSE